MGRAPDVFLQRFIFHHHPILITPSPVLARLGGDDHRMTRTVKVLGGVLVLRAIAAVHPTAGLAGTQVNPGVALLHTFLADIFVRSAYLSGIKMRARGVSVSHG